MYNKLKYLFLLNFNKAKATQNLVTLTLAYVTPIYTQKNNNSKNWIIFIIIIGMAWIIGVRTYNINKNNIKKEQENKILEKQKEIENELLLKKKYNSQNIEKEIFNYILKNNKDKFIFNNIGKRNSTTSLIDMDKDFNMENISIETIEYILDKLEIINKDINKTQKYSEKFINNVDLVLLKLKNLKEKK